MQRELGHDLLAIEDVQEAILSHLSALPAEERALAAAAGAVLREDLVAPEAVPSFASSAMDGFAVRAADLARASGGSPVTLRVAGEVAAGDPAPLTGLPPGRAFRIMTGAVIPGGADAVVPHELTRFTAEAATFLAPVKAGASVRPAGGDLRAGDLALAAGTVLRGPQLALAATLGRSAVLATRPPRIAILSPGKELIEPGRPRGPGQVWNSNAVLLAAALADAGAVPSDGGILPDDPGAILAAMERALAGGADAIITTGGASAGDYDFVHAVVREHARPGLVFKVAMRPGKPQVFGLLGGKPLFGLPGNPASAAISFEVFVRPALRKLRGEREVFDRPFGVRFPFTYRYKSGRVFLLRARVEPDEIAPPGGGAAGTTPPGAAGFHVVPPGEQDSSFLSSLAAANALIRLPAERDCAREGEVHPATWIGGRP